MEFKQFDEEICVYKYDMKIGKIINNQFIKDHTFVLSEQDKKEIEEKINQIKKVIIEQKKDYQKADVKPLCKPCNSSKNDKVEK